MKPLGHLSSHSWQTSPVLLEVFIYTFVGIRELCRFRCGYREVIIPTDMTSIYHGAFLGWRVSTVCFSKAGLSLGRDKGSTFGRKFQKIISSHHQLPPEMGLKDRRGTFGRKSRKPCLHTIHEQGIRLNIC